MRENGVRSEESKIGLCALVTIAVVYGCFWLSVGMLVGRYLWH